MLYHSIALPILFFLDGIEEDWIFGLSKNIKLMKKHFFTPILLFSLIFFSKGIFAQMNLTWADTLTKTLNQCRIDESMQGLAGGVVFSDGSIWTAASGFHGTASLSDQFLYDIGSNTKSMISAIILQLEDEGKLSIDDTLYQYISPIPMVSNGITLKQLLQHRSGVYSYTNNPSFATAINNDPNKFWHPDSILANFLNAPDFAPGGGFNYSNTGYVLLGKVIEVVDNRALNQALKARIFTPLGLDSIFLDQYDPYTIVKTGAWLNPTNYFPTDFVSFMSSAWAAGAVVSTPKDFALYAHGLLSGQLVSSASFVKMQQGSNIPGLGTYGLGIIKWNYKGKTYLGHGGTTLQNSEMEYSVDSDFSLVLMNIDQGFSAETARAKRKFLDLLEYIEEEQANISLKEKSIASIGMDVYPNPAINSVNIDLELEDKNSELILEIRDMRGNLILKTPVENQHLEIEKQSLGTGFFVASIFDKNNCLARKRIIFY